MKVRGTDTKHSLAMVEVDTQHTINQHELKNCSDYSMQQIVLSLNFDKITVLAFEVLVAHN